METTNSEKIVSNSENSASGSGLVAVIAGSTGLIGQELLKQLLNDARYTVVYSLVRKKSQSVHPKLVEILINYDDENFALSEIKKVDHVFCCLGTTMKKAGSKEAFKKVDYEYPLKLAQWARSMNASKFLCVSAMGADARSSIFYNQVKGEVERDINLMQIPAVIFFRPSLLLGDRKENRPGERVGIVLAKTFDFLFKGALKNYRAIHVSKVAAAMHKEAVGGVLGNRVVLSGEMQ